MTAAGRMAADSPEQDSPEQSNDSSGDDLQLRLADELDHARRLLQAMGVQLAADGEMVNRHGVALQSVDVVSQILGHVAGVIRSDAPHRTIEGIGMTELRARLTRRDRD